MVFAQVSIRKSSRNPRKKARSKDTRPSKMCLHLCNCFLDTSKKKGRKERPLQRNCLMRSTETEGSQMSHLQVGVEQICRDGGIAAGFQCRHLPIRSRLL